MRKPIITTLLLLLAACVNTSASSPKTALSPIQDVGDAICKPDNMPVSLLPALFTITIKADNSYELGIHSVTTSATKTNFDKTHVSPDGKKLVYLECTKDYSRDEEGHIDHAKGNCLCDRDEYVEKRVMISNIDGSDPEVVSEGPGLNEYPNWSPTSDSVMFMETTLDANRDINVFETELLAYRLSDKNKFKLTHTPCPQSSEESGDLESVPYCMMGDNFWNKDGSIVVVQNKVAWREETRPDGSTRLKPKIASPNNVFRFTPSFSHPAIEFEQLTDDDGFSIPESGGSDATHCCSADPRISPNGQILAYPRFNRDDPTHKDVDIVLRDLRSGNEQDVSDNDVFDGYPMFNDDGTKMLWTRYNQHRGVTSIVVKKVGSNEQPLVIDMIGYGVAPPPLGNVAVDFWLIRWPDWFHTKGDTIIFPGVINVSDRNIQEEVRRQLRKARL